MTSLTEEIAATAARLVVEEGLEYGPAKRRALRDLGGGRRVALPDNDAVEDAVRARFAFELERYGIAPLALRVSVGPIDRGGGKYLRFRRHFPEPDGI